MSPTHLLRALTVTVAAAVSLTVAAAPAAAAAPAGSSSAYSLQYVHDWILNKQVVERWNPCQTIAYKVNPGPLGATGIAEVQTAVSKLVAKTGIPMSYAGTTGYIPQNHDGFGDIEKQYAETGVRLVVALVPRSSSAAYEGASGRALVTSSGHTDAHTQIVSAAVLARPDLPAGFGAGNTRGKLIMHELGHAFGLQHVHDGIQIMDPGSTKSVAEWQAGDLTGLAKVGKPAGCIPGRSPLDSYDPNAPSPEAVYAECVAEQRAKMSRYGPVKRRTVLRALIARHC